MLEREIQELRFEEVNPEEHPKKRDINFHLKNLGGSKHSSKQTASSIKNIPSPQLSPEMARSKSRDDRRHQMQVLLEKQNLLINIGMIMKYIRAQFEIDTKKNDMLNPYEPNNFMLTIPYSNVRMKDLKKALLHSINKIYDYVQSFLEQVAGEHSPKQILLLATKARNVRNALRQIKGKKLKLLLSHLSVLDGSEARLSVRMLNASMNNPELTKELAEEDFHMLERMLTM